MLNYKRISKQREKLNLTQTELSKLIELPVETISRLEHGKQMNPTLLTLEKLAKGLQLRISDLVNEKVLTQ